MNPRVGRASSAFLVLLAVLLLVHCGHEGDSPKTVRDADPGPFDRARALTSAGRHAEAAREYERLAEEFALDGDSHNRWKATLERARSLFRTPRKEEAIAIIRQARELTDGNVEREIETTYLHTLFLHETGRLSEALEMGNETARWAARSNDPDLVWKGAVPATVLSLMGRYRESLAINERLVDRYRHELRDPRNLAQQLNEVGIDYRHLGRYDDARRVYEEALDYFRKEGPDRWLRIVLANLSTVYTETGDLDRSLALKLESLALLETMDAPYYLALTLAGVGEVYGRAGNLDQARHHLERAVAVSREAERPYALVGALLGLAGIELQTRSAATALELAVESMTIADRAEYGFQSAEARIVAAIAEKALGDPTAALRWAEDAVVRAEALEDPSLLLQARQARAGALGALGRREEATAEYARSIASLETWRGRLAMGDLRMGVTEPRISLYEEAIENLFALGRHERAFEIAERARARLLLELLALRDNDKSGDDRRAQLIERMRETYTTSIHSGSEEHRTAADRELDRLSEQIEALEGQSHRSAPGSASSALPSPLGSEEIRRALTSSQRALLVFFWGEEQVYGWWIGTAGIRGARLGSTEQLRPTIDFLRAALEQPGTAIEWQAAARRAFRQFVQPLEPSAVAELSIVPDGPLSLIPFEILIDAEESPWGVRKRIIYGPSASVLATLAGEREERRFGHTLLALGAPTLDAESTDRALRQGVALDSLQYAEEEVRRIAALFPAADAQLLVGSDATLDSWLDSEPGGFRYLHFATHAIVSDRHPERTHIVTAGGALDLATIRAQQLFAELVTISACESALGKRMSGEGIVGLPHAFLAAGARGVVVALWNVEDRVAAEFMRRFYGDMRRGMSTAESLQSVRRAWFEAGGDRSHPARWATFIQVGSRF